MVSFNFKAEFVPLIESDRKIQTIRAAQRCHPGDPMHLYTGLRTKACRLIRIETCVSVRPIMILPERIEALHQAAWMILTPEATEKFARADGFPHFAAMVDFFQETYGKDHFFGFCHRWAIHL